MTVNTQRERSKLSQELKAHVWRFTHGQCWYCGSYLNPFEDLCIDHVTPLAKGGDNRIDNLVPCCAYCNARKGVLTLDQWRLNFLTIPIDEEPWIDPSGVFWFERDMFFQDLRETEVRNWLRMQERPQ